MRTSELIFRRFLKAATAAIVLALIGLPQAAAQSEAETPPELPSLETPPELPSLETAIEHAVNWLVANQHDDGGWGSHHTARPIEVFCSPPGSHKAFRVATSALCVVALEDSPFKTAASRKAASRGIDYLLGAHNVKRMSGLEHYSVWAFGYGMQALGRWLNDHPNDARKEQLEAACNLLVVKLKRYQTLDGGWGYLSMSGLETYQPSDTSMCFTTAAILVGVDRAKQAGIVFPDKLVKRAVEQVRRSETPQGSFVYGEYLKYMPRYGINQPKGSACRTPCCQYAVGLFGHEYSLDAKRTGLKALLIDHIRFQKCGSRRPIPHESWYGISGYFYLFGMAYAGYLLDEMPDEDKARFSKPLFDAVMYCWQPDGSFWDYPLYSYHKPYGTAFALITLSRVRL